MTSGRGPTSTLIIKLGAMGDVLRTTTILHKLPGPVTWVTRPASLPLLENNARIDEVLAVEDAEQLRGRHFDRVACLDDDAEACQLLELVTWDEHIGAYVEGGRVRYGDSAAPWYDMGLVSRFGKECADQIKQQNTRCYQDFLFAMFGETFNGEEYVFGYAPEASPPRRIGVEMRADARWQLKRWGCYPELIESLRARGYDVFVFEQRDDLRDFIADVNGCALIVTGDTLTMHLALALRKSVIALFGPTSAPEIYDYGRLQKVVSPIDCICCYLRTCDKSPNCMDLIALESLESTVREMAGRMASQ